MGLTAVVSTNARRLELTRVVSADARRLELLIEELLISPHENSGSLDRWTIFCGASFAVHEDMWASRTAELIAYQLARELKLEVYGLLRAYPAAARDFSFNDQLTRAASRVEACIAEGHGRQVPGEFLQFLRYAVASIHEVEMWLQDGVDRKHYEAPAIQEGLSLAERCRSAATKLADSLRRMKTAGPPKPPAPSASPSPRKGKPPTRARPPSDQS